MKELPIGSTKITARGYVVVKVGPLCRRRRRRGRPRSTGDWRYQHDVIAEAALGHRLPDGAELHHVDEVKTNNANNNLAILQSSAEHQELHRKMRVRAAGGDPWRDRRCCDCGPRPADEFRKGDRWLAACRPCERRRALDNYYRRQAC
jgi:hypothetical protein